MNKDELIEEAKRGYPIGTTIKCAKDGELSTIIDDNYLWDHLNHCLYHKTNLNKNYQFIYANGNWATIIESSKINPKEENCDALVALLIKMGVK